MSEYKKEEAAQEASEIQELAGKKAGRDEYDLAEAMLMDEKSHDNKEVWESLHKGRITLMPRESNIYITIQLRTEDPEEFRLFNKAVHFLGDKYGSDCVSYQEKMGVAIWNFWKLPKDVLPYQVVQEIEAKMAEYKKLGW